MTDSLNLEIWDRLIQGKTLEGLSLGTIDGRVDLRGLKLPDSTVLRRIAFNDMQIAEVAPAAVFRGAKWANLDFSESVLGGIRFFGCEISNCKFDKCQLKGVRLWATKISETSFLGADLRKAVLGGVQEGKWNVFEGVNFTRADLRQTIYVAAAFNRCIFTNARLEGIDFQSSAFSNCHFEGTLRQIIFHRRGFKGEAFPENEMVNIDFSRATLRYVGFRGLRLDKVRFPIDSNHLVIRDYCCSLDRLISDFKKQNDIGSRKLVAYFGVSRKWAEPHQFQGILNIDDLTEVAGEECANRVRELLSEN